MLKKLKGVLHTTGAAYMNNNTVAFRPKLDGVGPVDNRPFTE